MDNNTLVLTDRELEYLLTLVQDDDNSLRSHPNYKAYGVLHDLLRKLNALGDAMSDRQDDRLFEGEEW